MKVKIACEATFEIKEFDTASDERKNEIVNFINNAMYIGVSKFTPYEADPLVNISWIDEEEPDFNEDLLKDI